MDTGWWEQIIVSWKDFKDLTVSLRIAFNLAPDKVRFRGKNRVKR